MNIDHNMRHVVVVILLCFGALFVQLNRVQVFQSEALRQHPANTRTVQRDFSRARGPIVSADGELVAHSIASEGAFELQRTYPHGELYAHLTGYLSFNIGAEGLERSYNDELVGRTAPQQLGGLTSLLGEQDPIGEVVMTVHHDLQRTARDALGERLGSVVAIDPRSGEVLALWSWPTYDPNLLASHSGTSVNDAYAELNAAEGNPLRARSYRDIFFPGSTFKVVTAAAALSTEVATLSSPVFDVEAAYTAPLTTRPLTNFGGSSCGGNLVEILRVSCNTGFASLGADLLGPERLIDQAQGFGFNSVPPIDLPGAVASSFPTDFGDELRAPSFEHPAGIFENSAALAQAAIGQNDVSASPLQMALVAAAIANDGVMMRPRVVSEVLDRKGETVISYDQREWLQPVDADVAADLRTAMVTVVEDGTASALARSDLVIGAKTGTAQLGTDSPQSHGWVIAYAGPPGQRPEIAIAVLVEASPEAPDRTGGSAAGPVVAALLETHFGQGNGG